MLIKESDDQMKKSYTTLLAGALLSLAPLISTIPSAQAAPNPTEEIKDPEPVHTPLIEDHGVLNSPSFKTVNQGDKINNIKYECTVGYVDKINRRLYTAKHCFEDGDNVYLKNGLRKVGTAHHFSPKNYDDGEKIADVEYILLDGSMRAASRKKQIFRGQYSSAVECGR